MASSDETRSAMPRYVQAIYTDWIGREVFRELMVATVAGLPTAVRYPDGTLYRLVAEGDRRAVYRQHLKEWNVSAGCTPIPATCRAPLAN